MDRADERQAANPTDGGPVVARLARCGWGVANSNAAADAPPWAIALIDVEARRALAGLHVIAFELSAVETDCGGPAPAALAERPIERSMAMIEAATAIHDVLLMSSLGKSKGKGSQRFPQVPILSQSQRVRLEEGIQRDPFPVIVGHNR